MRLDTSDSTATDLLVGLRFEESHAAWVEFHQRYLPIIVALARRLGLDDADANDVGQETMIAFLRDCRTGRFDPSRGRLRSWIFTNVRFRIADLHRRRARREVLLSEESSVDSTEAFTPEMESFWNQERDAVILHHALVKLECESRLDRQTLDAFRMTAIIGLAARDVAHAMNMAPADVYMAKRNVMRRLRDILPHVERLYDAG